jgi:hypothetical protein
LLRQPCNRVELDEFNNVEGRGGCGGRSRGHRYERMLYYVYTDVFKLFSDTQARLYKQDCNINYYIKLN